MPSIASHLQAVQQLIQQYALQYQRNPTDIHLIAVSKTRSVAAIISAWEAGQHAFAENYWQDAKPKLLALAHLPIEWHFIGSLQSNKCKVIAANFAWVHSVASKTVLQRLNQYRSPHQAPLKVFLQVNISAETQKDGLEATEVEPLLQLAQQLDRIQIVGLMGMAAASNDFQAQYQTFMRLTELRDKLVAQGYSCTQLSMGMTHDFQAAIAAGATYLRIGAGIFG